MGTYVVYVKASYQGVYEVEANSEEEARQALAADFAADVGEIEMVGMMDLGEEESSENWVINPK